MQGSGYLSKDWGKTDKGLIISVPYLLSSLILLPQILISTIVCIGVSVKFLTFEYLHYFPKVSFILKCAFKHQSKDLQSKYAINRQNAMPKTLNIGHSIIVIFWCVPSLYLSVFLSFCLLN